MPVRCASRHAARVRRAAQLLIALRNERTVEPTLRELSVALGTSSNWLARSMLSVERVVEELGGTPSLPARKAKKRKAKKRKAKKRTPKRSRDDMRYFGDYNPRR